MRRWMMLMRWGYHLEATLGTLIVFDENDRVMCDFATVEPPWRNNKVGVSCVMSGSYEIVLEMSAKFGMRLWELKGVPGRSEVKIHVANFSRQLEGCIAVGLGHGDIDRDGVPDVVESKAALDMLHEMMGDETRSRIEIIGRA